MLKKTFITVILLAISAWVFCQQPQHTSQPQDTSKSHKTKQPQNANQPQYESANSQFKVYEDSLKKLGKQIVNGKDETDRKSATYKFIPLLVRALKLPGSFDYPFDSVKTIRITLAPDNKFRIFNWFVNINDVAYRFYGAVQVNSPRKLELYPLIDYTENISKPEDTVTSSKKWYGAEYYAILPPDKKGIYLLLGWKGINENLTSRLIDALKFENGKLVFGAPVFSVSGQIKNRIIFKYTHQASMMLKYLPKKNLIVFDHLAPPDPKMKGKFESYGPDLSYDALHYTNGEWTLEENINLANEESSKDTNFITPDKAPVIK